MLIFKKDLPLNFNKQNCILIYDRRFDNLKWVQRFSKRYGVKSGERLKNIDELAKHLKKVVSLSEGISRSDMQIITLGGGSIGDFGGFIASILKRGVRLIHIPSTWLAAIDSAHGGKNGLNVSKIKNQVGTFYFPERIILVKKILERQPQERIIEALGEIFKTGLLNRKLWNQIKNTKSLSSDLYWKFLPELIQTKMKIVKKDPYETKQIRYYLNLGHTVGHVWESEFKLPHGIAVLFGLSFAIEWSFHKKLMSSSVYYDIRLSALGSYLPDRFDVRRLIKDTKNHRRLLSQDKKIASQNKMRFVFLQDIGKPIVAKITLRELEREFLRQSK
jgi:3-dehydroquinate synthase